MPVRRVSNLKPGDRVILDIGIGVVRAIHSEPPLFSNTETIRIEWLGQIADVAREYYQPSEILQVMPR